jgi:hypothetical protein
VLVLCIKRSRLVDHSRTGHKCLVFEWLWQPSCFNHSKTGPVFFLPSLAVVYKRTLFFVWFFNGLVLGCPVPATMDHSGTRQVRFLDGHCTGKFQSGNQMVYFFVCYITRFELPLVYRTIWLLNLPWPFEYQTDQIIGC